jgi:hypothetical protein
MTMMFGREGSAAAEPLAANLDIIANAIHAITPTGQPNPRHFIFLLPFRSPSPTSRPVGTSSL